ncbi:Sua5/YciO/YrdC/YwlC family protein [Aliiglaciecola sp. CAU 1673]|uniref:Sua5/YciO/YrdC/YwlC family protein n=1 Tax=Aliiglaciecola sp. CAU 1673 TaxID=3032595 RepID=UPI0023DA3C96|nr:Sua5/YciO/YrdC/YwlC family protein [Aliiglaciecola sp. CAU 1673]MDF2179759.1 Sua5/YciO/YrdC/YwlC family protein [Aliiglaciecola sp. CAU 1673]
MTDQQPPLPQQLIEQFQQGAILAYPTEAVFGLGCDPLNEDAVTALLAMKQRPMEKGVILVASNYSQLLPFVKDNAIPMERRTEIFSSWPGPNTWLLPKSSITPDWISGASPLVAVRVSAHPRVRQLCDTLNSPLVSTSANLSGRPPARTSDEVRKLFAEQVLLIEGCVGSQKNATQIRHGLSGQIIRAS